MMIFLSDDFNYATDMYVFCNNNNKETNCKYEYVYIQHVG